MRKTLIMLSLFFTIILYTVYSPAFAQDPGIPDTIRFLSCGSFVSCPPCTGRVIIPILVVNDESLWSMTIPLKWTGPLLFDSALFVGERSNFMSQKYVGRDSAGKSLFLFATVLAGEEFIPPGKGVLIDLYFTIQDTGYSIIDTCTPPLSFFHFIDQNENYFLPIFHQYEFQILGNSSLMGDVNQDGQITIADVVRLINYLFKSGPPPGYLHAGDVNADGGISVSDIIYFINYLFRGGPALGLGCHYS